MELSTRHRIVSVSWICIEKTDIWLKPDGLLMTEM